MTLFCTCGSTAARNDGFTNIASPPEEWWVHAGCGKPTAAWLGGRDDMLNLFRGGQLDGMVYETKTLITSVNLSVQGYTWTPDVVVSEKTGAKARVWIFGQEDSQQDGPAEEPTVTGPSSTVRPEGGHQMSDVSLEERRKNLKLSRQQLADEAGLTPAKVYRIERGGGRTTEEETQGLADVLTKLEGVDPS